MLGDALLRILVIFALVAANAFFVAAEFALVSVRSTRVHQLVEAHRIGARTVERLQTKLDELLAGVQLGVTLTSLALGWLGEPVVSHIVEEYLQGVPYGAVYAHVIAITLAFLAITYMHVLLGEIVPKSLALQRAEQVALAVAGPMEFFLAISRPFLWVLKGSAGVALRAFDLQSIPERAVHSSDELKLMVTASRHVGILPPFQEATIRKVLEFDEVSVREVMVPRHKIFSLPGNMTLEAASKRIVEEQHSRIPVYDPASGPEHIVGVIYAKDVMRWMGLRLRLSPSQPAYARLERMTLAQVMRNVLVVPETKDLADLLEEFKTNRRHMAVVVDEFGSTAGLVTAEDLLEQLVGEIEDEFDTEESPNSVFDFSSMILEGAVSLLDLESQYRLELPRDHGFETLAGFVLDQLQKIPTVGDTFDFEGRHYTVDQMEGHRISQVRIETAQPEPAPAPTAPSPLKA